MVERSSRCRRTVAAAVVAPDRARFAAGWRLIGDALPQADDLVGAGRSEPSIVVDVIRPCDLVAFTVEAHGMELVDGSQAHLRVSSGERNPRLVYRLAYQHLGERAIYEGLLLVQNPDDLDGPLIPGPVGADGPGVIHAPPSLDNQAVPARGSRLVLAVPEDAQIPFTTVGLLEALEQFPMAVHPLAKPRATIARPGPVEGLVLHRANDLIAVVSGSDIVVQQPPRAMKLPDRSTATGLATIARDTRRLHDLLATTRGVAATAAAAAAAAPIGRRGPVSFERRIGVRPRAELSRDTTRLETAIEAPYRLVISPSVRGGWAHAKGPVGAQGAEHRVELWHSRLGVRDEPADPERPVTIDERRSGQRIIRAVWARDRQKHPDWETPTGGPTHQTSAPRACPSMRPIATSWCGRLPRRGSERAASPSCPNR